MLNKDCVCTDVGEAFLIFLQKCKCDENMFRCQNKHTTYSIVLMYIGFCGATFSIMARQFHIVWWKVAVAEVAETN